MTIGRELWHAVDPLAPLMSLDALPAGAPRKQIELKEEDKEAAPEYGVWHMANPQDSSYAARRVKVTRRDQ
ncbi:MAG: hypothetical protein WCA32_21950 [Chromatiaceae bacterium]